MENLQEPKKPFFIDSSEPSTVSDTLTDVQKNLNDSPNLNVEKRSNFSKASEAVGSVILGAGAAVIGTAAVGAGLVGAAAVVAGTAALVAAGVALGAASVIAASPFLALGGVAYLSYMGTKKAMDASSQAHDELKAKAKDKGYAGESPIKDFCKDQACKVGGQIKNFFTQRLRETAGLPVSQFEAIEKREKIQKTIEKSFFDKETLISDADSKFMENIKDKTGNFSDKEINRLVNIYTKVKGRDQVCKKISDLVSYSDKKYILNDVGVGIPKEAKSQLEGLINKMLPSDTPAKPLSRDEIKLAMIIIGNIETKQDIGRKLNEIKEYFTTQYQKDTEGVDPEGLKKFNEKLSNFNKKYENAFISKKSVDNVNDLYDYYLAASDPEEITETNKYYGKRENSGDENQKLQKGLYLDYKERESLREESVNPDLDSSRNSQPEIDLSNYLFSDEIIDQEDFLAATSDLSKINLLDPNLFQSEDVDARAKIDIKDVIRSRIEQFDPRNSIYLISAEEEEVLNNLEDSNNTKPLLKEILDRCTAFDALNDLRNNLNISQDHKNRLFELIDELNHPLSSNQVNELIRMHDEYNFI